MKKTYVILRRIAAKDYVFIMDAETAKKENWIDDKGNRIWYIPVERENNPTFVWEFDSVNKANIFYEMMKKEIGIKVYASN